MSSSVLESAPAQASRDAATYTFTSESVTEGHPDKVCDFISDSVLDFRPAAIIERLDLLRPLYRRSTNYGHFGKPDLPWEA